MAASRPVRFGRYALVDRLGEGGMSEVWKAIARGPGGVEKLVAVKRIRSFLAADEDFVEMFTDEARVSSLLQHPGIVSVFDFGAIGPSWYLAMECVEGKDLRALGRRLQDTRQVLDIDQAVYVIHAMCGALDYAHRLRGLDGRPLGLIHRDIKPSNIVVSYDGDVKLLDFGIARAVSNTRTTGAGLLAGSVHYMSPEQAAGEPMGPRSDLFSAGVVLYELLTGRRLFRADSREASLALVREARFTPASQLRALPDGLDEVLARALARAPEDRYPDAHAMQMALEPFLGPGQARVRARLASLLDALFAEERRREQARLDEGRAANAAALLADDEPTPPPALDAEDAATELVETLTIDPEATVPASDPTPVAAPVVVPAPAPAPRSRWPVAVLGLALLVGLVWTLAPTPTPAPAPVAAPAPVVPVEVSAPVPPPAAPIVAPVAAPVTSPPRPSRPNVTSAPAAAPPKAPVEAPVEAAPVVEATPAVEAAPVVEATPVVEAAPAPATITVSVTSGWARVYIDGKAVAGTTPLVDHALAPGTHEIRVEQPSSGRVWRRKVVLEPGQSSRVSFDVD